MMRHQPHAVRPPCDRPRPRATARVASALVLIVAGLAVPLTGKAQTGPCQDGRQWRVAETGRAAYGACDGGEDLLTFACTDADAPVTGLLSLPDADFPEGAGVEATLSVGDAGRYRTVLGDRGTGGGTQGFEASPEAMQALARARSASLDWPGGRLDLHLRGSMAAIRAMYRGCTPDAATPGPEAGAAVAGDGETGEAPDVPAGDAPAGAEGDATPAAFRGPDAGDAALADGTAPDAQVIEAFRTAWSGEPPPLPDADLPAPARCGALAGGPVAGFGTDVPVAFVHLGGRAEAGLAACDAAMAAEPDAPRHAFHAARLHLALGDDAAALPLIRQAARAGFAPAMNALAVALLRGRAEPRGAEVPADLLDRAALQDYPPAAANLALGQIGERDLTDFSRALELARRAAELGDPVGATQMGIMAFHGYGRPDDAAEAVRWYRIGAARGDPDALTYLADALRRGDGPWEDYQATAIEAGHRASLVAKGLLGSGAVPAERLEAALRSDPIERARDAGLRYVTDGRDSDGGLYWLLMWQRRAAEDGWGASAAELEPLSDALRSRYDCRDGRLYKITEARLGCEK